MPIDLRNVLLLSATLSVSGVAIARDPLTNDVYPDKLLIPHSGLTSRLGPAQTPFGYGSMAVVWPHAPGRPTRIPVCWEDQDSRAPFPSLVREAVEVTWEAAAAVDFTGWDRCGGDTDGVRIKVDLIGSSTMGLGTSLRGVAAGVTLDFDMTYLPTDDWCRKDEGSRRECIKAVAVHEFGHVLGLAHEQNRPDKPRECEELAQGPLGSMYLTPWDPASVMNYCHPIYGPGGWTLSPGDVASVRIMYGVR